MLDSEILARTIRSARRGAGPGPSGMTANHLRVILESVEDTSSFSRVAQALARAQVLPDALTLLRMGRLTALLAAAFAASCAGTKCADLSLGQPHSRSHQLWRNNFPTPACICHKKMDGNVWHMQFSCRQIWTIERRFCWLMGSVRSI